MRLTQLVLIGSVIALLGVTSAHATVTYAWHPTGPGPIATTAGGELAITPISGELVVTNAAYFAGSIDFYVNYPNPGPGNTSPGVTYSPNFFRITNSPVISVNLFFGLFYPSYDTIFPAFGIGVVPGSDYFTNNEFPFYSSLTFNNDGMVSGDLFLTDESDVASVDGGGYSWSVSGLASDYFNTGECSNSQMSCSAGSGYWQLSSVSVPEPPALPFLGLGALGLFLLGLQRQRRRGSQKVGESVNFAVSGHALRAFLDAQSRIGLYGPLGVRNMHDNSKQGVRRVLAHGRGMNVIGQVAAKLV